MKIRSPNDQLLESVAPHNNSDESTVSTLCSGCSRTPKSLTSSSSTSFSAPSDNTTPNESIWQLSGNSLNSQPFNSPQQARPELALSPTQLKLFPTQIKLSSTIKSSSSSSEDEIRKRQLRQGHPDTQGYEVPSWCKHIPEEESHSKNSTDSCNLGGSSEPVTGQTEITSTQDNIEPIFSGTDDMFMPRRDNKGQKNSEIFAEPCLDSQPSIPLNMELSQDFSQKPKVERPLEKPVVLDSMKRKRNDVTEAPQKKSKTVEWKTTGNDDCSMSDQAKDCGMSGQPSTFTCTYCGTRTQPGSSGTNVQLNNISSYENIEVIECAVSNTPMKVNDSVYVRQINEEYHAARVTEVSDDDKIVVTMVSNNQVQTVSVSDVIKLPDKILKIKRTEVISNDNHSTGEVNVEPSKKSKKRVVKTTTTSSSSPQYEKRVLRHRLKGPKSKLDPRKLFSGYSFFLTSDSDGNVMNSPGFYHQDNTSGTDADETVFDRDCLTNMIEKHGGIVIKKLNRRNIRRESPLLCISNKISRTTKFLYCVVVGIPIVWDSWVKECISSNQLLPLQNFTVPAGRDIMGCDVEQRIFDDTSERDPYTPLFPLKIFVHLGTDRVGREIDLLLETAGAEQVFKFYNITKKTKRVLLDVASVDFILTLVNRVPAVLWEEAQRHGKTILTPEWLIQCLTNNQLYDVDISPLFKYTHEKEK